MKNIVKYSFIASLLLLCWSCSDLNEQILDESLSGGASESDIIESCVAPAYALLPDFFKHTRYFALQEISSDEAILPYRGGQDWGDNGIYIELHQHTYTPVHSNIQGCWDGLTTMISRTVTAISVLEPLSETDSSAESYLFEMRALQAYYNMVTLDLWGVVLKKDDPNVLTEILRGDEAVDYLQLEFESLLDKVRTDVGPGRVSQSALYGLLARLHLNAAVWRNPYSSPIEFSSSDMDKVIEYTTKIIESGDYSLSEEYFACFDNDNHTNSELIFAVDQRAELNGHNRMSYFSMSSGFYGNPLYPEGNGTDGAAITSDFYQTWVEANGSTDAADADARFWWNRLVIPADSAVTAEEFEVNRGIYRGPQYGLLNSGAKQPFLMSDDGEYKLGKMRDWRIAEYDAYVDFVETIDFTSEGSNYNTGFRVEKYQWSKESTSGRNKGEADLVILRLADCYLMRAEALLRGAGDAAGALADLNTVRASRTARPEATPKPLSAIDLDILFRERGFEFYWEHQRRTDMIRFGKYEDSWTEKSDSDVRKRLFPIPQTAIDGASDLDGYLIQNEAYL